MEMNTLVFFSMTSAIVILIAAYFSSTKILIAVCVFCGLKLIALMQRSNLELCYDKDNKLFKDFVSKSNIKQLVYEPHILAPSPALQGIVYLIYELIIQWISPSVFEIELVKMDDGGTCGLAWDGGIPSEDKPLNQPLLIICPGLGGSA